MSPVIHEIVAMATHGSPENEMVIAGIEKPKT
jgi:hypothetical protein